MGHPSVLAEDGVVVLDEPVGWLDVELGHGTEQCTLTGSELC
jgi:hypothetical protein